MFDRTFQRIATNGIELNTVVEGEGPLVVLLHGFPQGAFLWRHQIDPIINAGFRVAVPDQRGYGSSSAPEDVSAYNIRELANDAAGIAPALGYDRFIVIGHDWGSLVAWHTALLHERTCRAVMGLSVPYTRADDTDGFINPPGMDDRFWYMRYFQDPGVAEAELEADVRGSLLAMLHTLSAASPAGSWMAQLNHPRNSKLRDALVTTDSLPSWLTQEEFDDHVRLYERNGFRGPINWYRNLAVMNDVTPELAGKKVAQPCAFVAGAEDDVLQYIPGQSWVELMKPFLSDLQFITLIEGAGHWVQLERPEETTQEILRFLETVR
jgi:pimeloyl-ACP methyl ester carboxylesterase